MLSHDSTYQQTLKAKLANSVKLIQATTVKPLPPISSSPTLIAASPSHGSMLTSTPMMHSSQSPLNNMIFLNASTTTTTTSPSINAANLFSNFIASAPSSCSNTASFITTGHHNQMQPNQQQIMQNQVAILSGMSSNNSPTQAPIILKYAPNTASTNTNIGTLLNTANANAVGVNGQTIFLTTSNNLPFQTQFNQNQIHLIPSSTGNSSPTSFTNLVATNVAAPTTNSNAPSTSNATTRKPRQKKEPEPPPPLILPPNFSNSKKFKISSIFKPLITKDNHPCLVPSPTSPPYVPPQAKTSGKHLVKNDATIIKDTVDSIVDKIILNFAREERALANKQKTSKPPPLPSTTTAFTDATQNELGHMNESILSVVRENATTTNKTTTLVNSVKKVREKNKNNCLANEKQFVAGKRKKMVQATENSFVIMNKTTNASELEKEAEEERQNAPKRIRLNEAEEIDKGNSVDETCQNNNLGKAVTISDESSCSQSSEVKGDDSSSLAIAQNVTSISSSTSTSQFTCKFCQKDFTNSSRFYFFH
jgi:hypothetical protein